MPYTEGDDGGTPILYIGPEVEEIQLKRLEGVKRSRNQASVDSALARITAEASRPEVNTMPAILDAVKAYATVGEIVDALAEPFGLWTEIPVL